MKDIKEYKEDLIKKLESVGIPDTGFTLKEAKKSKPNSLGWYKGGSQLRSRPIIYVDLAMHESELRAISESEKVDQAVIDTMLHEYGHVIEEYIAFDNRINGNQYFKILQEKFDDMEDFAELFAKYVNADVYINAEKTEAIFEVIEFYKKSIFTPSALEEIQKPQWEREFNQLLKKFEKSSEKLRTQEGSFNKCLAISEAFFERMSDETDMKILRLQGYSDSLDNAHIKWQKFKDRDFITHYVLAHDEKIIDLTAKQFDSNADFPQISTLTDICGKWNQIEEFRVKSVNKVPHKSSPK